MAQKRFAVMNFQGVNSKVSNFLKPVEELKSAQNIDLSEIGTVKKAKGYTKVGDTLESGKNILGLFDYQQVGGTTRQLAVVNNSGDTASGLEYNNGGTWTSISGANALTADSQMEFAYFAMIDYVLMVNDDDATASLTGLTYSTSTNVTNAPKGKDIVLFKNQFYIIGRSTKRATVYYSDLPASDDSIAWDNTNNYFHIPSSEPLTACAVNGDQLLIFTDSSLWRCSAEGIGLERVHGAPGTHSPKQVFTVGRFTFYFNRTGFYAYDGVGSQRISNKIEDYVSDIDQTKLANVCGAPLGTHAYWFVDDLSTKSINQAGLDYDIVGNTWAPLGYGVTPKVVAPFIVSGAQKLYMGADDGNVYELFEDDNFNEGAINGRLRTNDFGMGYPEYQKTIKAMYLIAKKQTGTTLTVKVSKDFGTYVAYGTVDLGTDNLIVEKFSVEDTTAKHISWEFSNNAADQPFEIYGFVVYYDLHKDWD